jgi:hypothetical protein
MKAHSYTGRITPVFPFLTYLPLKPEPQPGSGQREVEEPTHPHKDQHPQHGSRHSGLEPTH